MNGSNVNWADMADGKQEGSDEGEWMPAVSARTQKRRNRRIAKTKEMQLLTSAADMPGYIDRATALEIQGNVKIQGFVHFITSVRGLEVQSVSRLIGFHKNSAGYIDLKGNSLAEPTTGYDVVTIPDNDWNDQCIFVHYNL